MAHLAGWKNVQTVNEYSVPSVEQQQETSDIISNIMLPKKPSEEQSTEVCVLSKNKENINSDQSPTAKQMSVTKCSYSNKQMSYPYAFMSGANISGGTFNINIFSGKKSFIRTI